ncbi:MAG: hypothetical protein JWP89_2023 [Schlesneria sp.]|nr:hypothetical protein [Schlesneria sp.]
MMSDETTEAISPPERWGTCLLIFLAVLLHTIALVNAKPLQSANDRSRWCTVWSLVERGTFQIDEIRQESGWDSIDIIHDGGHFYSTKPPLLSIIVAGVTWCVQRVTGWTLLENTHAVTTLVLIVINIIPFGVSLGVMSRLLRRVSDSSWCRLSVLAATAFGTLVTPFLMTLNNHTVAVVGVMLSLYALQQLLSEERPSAWSFLLCGAAAGWACANELPAVAFGLATFFLAARISIRQTLCWYVPAAIVPLAAFLATNVIATGSLKPTYASYGSAKYNFVIDGVPSYWMDPDGVDRNLDSPATYFLHCTIGHHGIFSLTPLFLLSLAGWLFSGSIRNASLRTLVRLGAVMTVLVVGFYMTRTNNYNYGGVSCGLRWAIWLIPFWLLAMVPAVEFATRITVLRWLQCVLFAFSAISAWVPIENPWQQPWLFRRMEAWKWIDYTRKPAELPRKLWTWFQSIPDPQGSPWIEFSLQNSDGTIKRRRLTCSKIESDTPTGLVEVEVTEADGNGELKLVRRFRIDVERFLAGDSTADFVRWHEPASVTNEQKQADFTFVRALPLKKEFRAGKFRYLHLPLRSDAFRCQLAAAAVDYPQNEPTHQYRCDTWLCDELPFGVAQYEVRVMDVESVAIVHLERWTVSACSPLPAATAPVFKRN